MNDTLKNIFQTLSENAEENFIKNKNAEDYLAEDGLWHCGKCGTAKQFRLPERFLKMGMPEIVGCCCACQSAKEKRENAKQRLASVIRQNKEIANIPEHYLSADIAMVESPEAKRIGMNYIKNFEKLGRIGLLLYGDVGTGKTYLAAYIANALLNQGVSVKWLTTMQIVERSCFYSESEYACLLYTSHWSKRTHTANPAKPRQPDGEPRTADCRCPENRPRQNEPILQNGQSPIHRTVEPKKAHQHGTVCRHLVYGERGKLRQKSALQ